MGRERRLRLRDGLWVAALVLAALLYTLQRGAVRVAPAGQAPFAGPLRVRTLDGAERTLAGLRGEVVLLNLWASWCGPCRREVPRLRRIASELRDDGLVVWGLNDEGLAAADLAEVARELGIDYEVVQLVDGLRGALAGRGVVPHTWLVDREGRVRVSHAGVPGERSLRRACEKLLAEPAGGISSR